MIPFVTAIIYSLQRYNLAFPDARAFSVQYHPESSPGPHDVDYLFDRFVKLMEKEKVATTDEHR